MRLKLALAAAVLAFGFATPSFAAPANLGFPLQPAAWQQHFRPQTWQLIGQRIVNQRGDHDTIFAGGHARYQQLMLCVYGQPVRMNDVDVRFNNGGRQDVNVRNVIGANQCSRAIDLYGQRRDIKSVSLAYRALGFGRGALVKVFAR